jgi:hypothetical protein
MPRRLCLLLTLPVFAASATSAQPRHLETLEGAFSVVVSLGDAYGGQWSTEPGGALRVGTEFYGGRVHLAFHTFANQPLELGLPEFHAYRGEVGWGATLALPVQGRLTAGAAVGAINMRFEPDERFPMALQNETELTASLFARLDAPVAGPVRVFAGADLARVATAEPIVYRFVQGGFALVIPAPAWLRTFLR